MDHSKLLQEEYGNDKEAQILIKDLRQKGATDEEIYYFLESFY